MNSNKKPLQEHDEIEEFKNVESSPEPKDAGSIYEDGNVLRISIDELKGNDVAIRQLVNEHNLSQRELKRLGKSIALKESEIEYLKTSPFISILSLIVNVICIAVLGIGVNIITGGKTPTIGIALVALGGIGSAVSSIATILYPYARGFFNFKKSKVPPKGVKEK
jgi:hypothetical protein